MTFFEALTRWLGIDCAVGEPAEPSVPDPEPIPEHRVLVAALADVFATDEGQRLWDQMTPYIAAYFAAVEEAAGFARSLGIVFESSPADGEAASDRGPAAGGSPAPVVAPDPAGAGHPNIQVEPGFNSSERWALRRLIEERFPDRSGP